MSKRGLFIIVEGLDRSGKSTQCQRLVDHLEKEGISSRLLKFPDRTTPTGVMIDQYLKQTRHLDDHAVHLLFSANRWEAMDSIALLLEQGITLVADRYAFSGVAFSAAKGLDRAWCRHPDVGLIQPDLVLFLDVPIEVAEQRGGFGEERYEKRELQLRVRDEFLQLADNEWKIVDASPTMDSVEETMWSHVKLALEQPRSATVQHDLWISPPLDS